MCRATVIADERASPRPARAAERGPIVGCPRGDATAACGGATGGASRIGPAAAPLAGGGAPSAVLSYLSYRTCPETLTASHRRRLAGVAQSAGTAVPGRRSVNTTRRARLAARSISPLVHSSS